MGKKKKQKHSIFYGASKGLFVTDRAPRRSPENHAIPQKFPSPPLWAAVTTKNTRMLNKSANTKMV